MEEKKETVLTSVEQLNEFLKEKGDGRTIISIELVPGGEENTEGGGGNG